MNPAVWRFWAFCALVKSSNLHILKAVEKNDSQRLPRQPNLRNQAGEESGSARYLGFDSSLSELQL
jgi:hypothetical protein